ncbi:MAG: hypothetical protein GXO33_07745 [Epsilonproteobacteria bacterium]|nr:hypothetical protein [Campylobacterota bacterium]
MQAYRRIKNGLAILNGAPPFTPQQIGKFIKNEWRVIEQLDDYTQKCRDLYRLGENYRQLVERYEVLKDSI